MWMTLFITQLRYHSTHHSVASLQFPKSYIFPSICAPSLQITVGILLGPEHLLFLYFWENKVWKMQRRFNIVARYLTLSVQFLQLFFGLKMTFPMTNVQTANIIRLTRIRFCQVRITLSTGHVVQMENLPTQSHWSKFGQFQANLSVGTINS